MSLSSLNPIASRSKKKRMRKVKSIIDGLNSEYGSQIITNNVRFNTSYKTVQEKIKSNIKYGKLIKKLTNNTEGLKYNQLEEKYKEMKQMKQTVVDLQHKLDIERAVSRGINAERDRDRDRGRDRDRDRGRDRDRDRDNNRGKIRIPNKYVISNGQHLVDMRNRRRVYKNSKGNFILLGGYNKQSIKKSTKKKSPKVHTGPRGGKYIIKRGKKIYQ